MHRVINSDYFSLLSTSLTSLIDFNRIELFEHFIPFSRRYYCWSKFFETQKKNKKQKQTSFFECCALQSSTLSTFVSVTWSNIIFFNYYGHVCLYEMKVFINSCKCINVSLKFNLFSSFLFSFSFCSYVYFPLLLKWY